MPRNLPWLLDENENTRVKNSITPRKRVKREQDQDATPKQQPISPDKKDFFPSSQTPPTSPARPCPTEEFLIQGLDKDDGWVMVEDEFYTIAQSFTRHLHYAEYVKRKKEAKAKAAEGTGEVERPTDGRTSVSKDQEMRKKALTARQKAGLNQMDAQSDDNNDYGADGDEEDDDDNIWAGTHLHGLMTSPRRVRSLAGAHVVKSNTRAAAGFRQTTGSQANSSSSARRIIIHTSPSRPLRSVQSRMVVLDEETASEDDDLDGPSQSTPVPARYVGNAHQTGAKRSPRTVERAQKSESSTSRQVVTPTRASQKPPPKFKSKVQMLFDDLDDYDGLPEPSTSKSPVTEKKSKSRFNAVPTFLG
ncbi:hypothetical protein N7495_005409 [Penicillium taxi]|uniref:uncharacterized protein n=1 Tax=Penicillium taxi TaxID=168475 RepID=UPI002545489F|nr:uncharacterized protein N7495_005409 [Penicillium taxi]KAJ5893718.1 hypothetical protein N7495_005409 [Penicillium taxi]